MRVQLVLFAPKGLPSAPYDTLDEAGQTDKRMAVCRELLATRTTAVIASPFQRQHRRAFVFH
ncbi:MAG: hypothetical protein ACJ74Y_16995 [Bryobacteraceae bacterium]